MQYKNISILQRIGNAAFNQHHANSNKPLSRLEAICEGTRVGLNADECFYIVYNTRIAETLDMCDEGDNYGSFKQRVSPWLRMFGETTANPCVHLAERHMFKVPVDFNEHLKSSKQLVRNSDEALGRYVAHRTAGRLARYLSQSEAQRKPSAGKLLANNIYL